jgi:imidazolonepropionase-like amidohydrolase
MYMRNGLLLLLAVLSACKAPEDSHAKALIGAVLIDGSGGPPLSNSLVVVSEGRIREAGRQGEIPVSAEANKIDGSGRFIVPGFVDVSPQGNPPAFTAPGPATADDAKEQIAKLATQKTAAIHVWPAGMQPAMVEALLEAARSAGIAIVGHPVTQAEAQLLVQNGASLLIGMIRDTDALDPVFVTRLRDLRIVYAPELNKIPPTDAERANHNTARLFAAGVPLAVASGSGDFIGECELLARAGVPPLDVIVAATENGAKALGKSNDRGTIQAGKRADLLLLKANPGEDIRNLRRLDRKMTNGDWQ